MRTDANFMRSTLAALALFGCIAIAAAGKISPAYAGATVQLPVDQARVVELAGEPGTIVVGNPSVADVSVRNGNLLIIQGKAYGTTNIIVLTRDGEQIANMDVLVQSNNKHALSIYSSAGRRSFRCKPFCEGELNAGDSEGFFKKVEDQNSKKADVAKAGAGTTAGED